MFRWHSTIVDPSRQTAQPTSTAAAAPQADASKTATQRKVEQAYRSFVEAGAGLQRDDSNRIVNPAPLQRALASEGVRLGPEGMGTLLALCDRVPIRPPSLAEFTRCVLLPGTTIEQGSGGGAQCM